MQVRSHIGPFFAADPPASFGHQVGTKAADDRSEHDACPEQHQSGNTDAANGLPETQTHKRRADHTSEQQRQTKYDPGANGAILHVTQRAKPIETAPIKPDRDRSTDEYRGPHQRPKERQAVDGRQHHQTGENHARRDQSDLRCHGLVNRDIGLCRQRTSTHEEPCRHVQHKAPPASEREHHKRHPDVRRIDTDFSGDTCGGAGHQSVFWVEPWELPYVERWTGTGRGPTGRVDRGTHHPIVARQT